MNDTEGHVDILVCMAGTGGTGFDMYPVFWTLDEK